MSNKTAHSLLRLRKRFNNCVLDDTYRHPDEGITELESMCYVFIHILNNLPELYDVVLDGMENILMLKESDLNKQTQEQVLEKLNNRYGYDQDKNFKLIEIGQMTMPMLMVVSM